MTRRNNTKTKTAKNKQLTADSVILQKQHIPVLFEEVYGALSPKKGETYLDLTAGYGGHAERIITDVGQDNATLVDRDKNAIIALSKLFNASEIIHSDYASVLREMISEGRDFDLILADIGVSSPHLDNSDRGFSFQYDGPLDMRMDQDIGPTAAQVILDLPEETLANVLYEYGEEYSSRKLARAIKAAKPETTKQLADVVESVIPRRGKTHPATKTFQALRIYVNEELVQLDTLLELAPQLLRPGGRLAVISFHSLEDRRVKHEFAQLSVGEYESNFRQLNKKVIQPSQQEIDFNPRSRSAKLRVLVKK